ncbi:type II toxin-antitoxin system RelE/ParE family toxin [Marinobacterium aestuarii]|uniref:type II toxin-antitoxin system RelE/ParE family toxin n=1 Tax=Marinobacterium aestuarii TaxID=1821621 RepID=UPI000A033D54
MEPLFASKESKKCLKTAFPSRRPVKPDRLLGEVEATLGRIAESPSLYPRVHRGTHRALIQKFPFGIFYRVVGDVVIVIAVMHASRNPRRWKSRS